MRLKFVLQPLPSHRAIFLLLMLLSSVSCSLMPGQDPAVTNTPEQTRTAAVFPTVTPTVAPTATATITPEPTSVPPSVNVSDQEVGEDGVLVIEEAALPQAGWLAVFSVTDGAADELLGYVDLPDGVHRNIRVTIDPFLATETMLARLHTDAGSLQEFELPEPDVPMADTAMAEFGVTVTLPQPVVVVDDQAVGSDGVVTVNEVRALAPTWLVIHADNDGAAGPVLGQVLLETGEYERVPVTIRWQQGTPKLHAILHEDTGEIGYLDFPAADQPIIANGSAVAATFGATFPPDVLVYDQPVIDGKVVIERVISNGPGWVVVQFDDNGQPGLIIGESPLLDGLNEQVEVDLIQAALTPVLYARIHQDSEPGDAFNFPEVDPPVMFEERLPQAQRFRTDIGSYIVINDQNVSEEDQVVAAVVMATSNAWLVIHADDEGALGPVIGTASVPAGINRNVPVTFDSIPSAGLFHAVLYQDVGDVGEFEFPGGPDSPFRVQGGTVGVPFQILGSSTES